MTCPRCRAHVDRAQDCHGAYAAYPCQHWLTEVQAGDLPTTYRPRPTERTSRDR